MKYTLRPYQEKAIAELHKWIATNEGNPLLVAPTGSGKSLLISSFISDCLEQWPHLKILVLQHRKELVAQNFQKLVATLDPKISIGIYSAGLGKKQLGKQVTFAGVQSIYRNVEKLGQIHLIIADECDLIPPSGEGTWRTVIDSLKEVNPRLRVVGFTATPFRLSTGSLIDDDGVFNAIAHQIDMLPLIRDGYLSPLISKSSVETPDISELKLRNGEFAAKETESLYNTRALSLAVLKEIHRYASDRKKILVFCSGIEHAEYFAKLLREQGHAAESLTGETSSLFRDQILKDFSSGRIRFLTNCDVLTVGYDEPAIDCIVMLRPTQSARLYCQIIGRGSRIAEGKEDCIASGQKVLTDQGLIPIEKVTLEMKVWDGCSFVSHCGIVFRGKQKVIKYAGLTATEDHKVWTEEGWKTFRECAAEQIPIAITGDGREAIEIDQGYFRKSISSGQKQSSLSKNNLSRMREGRQEILRFYQQTNRWLSKVWEKKKHLKALLGRPEMVAYEMYPSKAKMLEPRQPVLSSLWWPWNKVQLQISERNGTMGNGQLRHRSKLADRQSKQRWALRSWKLKTFNSFRKWMQHARIERHSRDAQIQNSFPTYKVCGLNYCKSIASRVLFPRDRRKILSTLFQTEREVWDILNAGPFHRFTVEGLLVSNCLILDYAGNIERHGPVDKIRVKKTGSRAIDGKITVRNEVVKEQVKVCPRCRNCYEISVAVSTCGFVFPDVAEIEVKHEATASGKSVTSDNAKPQIEEFEVSFVDYGLHAKEGKPDSLKITYNIGMSFKIYDFLCLEHSGFARKVAEQKWKNFSADKRSPVPDTVQEALFCIETGDLKKPAKIRCRKDDKGYWSAVAYKWRPKIEEGNVLAIYDENDLPF